MELTFGSVHPVHLAAGLVGTWEGYYEWRPGPSPALEVVQVIPVLGAALPARPAPHDPGHLMPGEPDADPTVADAAERLHTASMPNLLVRDLPDEVHAELQRRAERHGQSLQQYLTDELSQLVARPEIDEVLERIARRRGGRVGLARAAEQVAEDRERR